MAFFLTKRSLRDPLCARTRRSRTVAYKQDRSGSAGGLIQRSAWKGNSKKFVSSIRHSPGLISRRTPPCQNQPTAKGGKGTCFGDSGALLPPAQPKDDSYPHFHYSQRRVRRGGLRSAGRPADGLALGAVVPLSSFATIVLRGRAVWGRRFGGSKEPGKCD